jgi:hypothetical protein
MYGFRRKTTALPTIGRQSNEGIRGVIENLGQMNEFTIGHPNRVRSIDTSRASPVTS